MILDAISGGNISLSNLLIGVLSSLAVIFLTMPVHEYAHALIAYKLGDKTQQYSGRLTLNPFAHIDWIGAASILLVGFGWGKPVQVNPYYFKKHKRDMGLTALAGPVSNLIVGFIAVFIGNLFHFISYKVSLAIFSYIGLFFGYIAIINISLAVFNLIPVPPLDGSKILAIILPDRLYYNLMQYERYFSFILLALIFTGVLSRPMFIAREFIFDLFNSITSLPFTLLL